MCICQSKHNNLYNILFINTCFMLLAIFSMKMYKNCCVLTEKNSIEYFCETWKPIIKYAYIYKFIKIYIHTHFMLKRENMRIIHGGIGRTL